MSARGARLLVGFGGLAMAMQAAWAMQTVLVTQSGRAFSLREAHIARGDTIRFRNADEFAHQLYVKASEFDFSSDPQEQGQEVAIRFPFHGMFDVRCEIHPKMRLAVTVE